MKENSKVETGMLSIWDVSCRFTLENGTILKIVPEGSQLELFRKKCEELSHNFDNLDWIFGKTQYDYDIAFLPSSRQGELCLYKGELTLVIDIYLTYLNSKNVDGRYLYDYKDLHGFTAIDFCGIPVDSCFSPNYIVNKTRTRKDKIEFLSSEEYSKIFETEIDGHKCFLSFTVEIDRKDLEPENNQLGELRSILRIEFLERQNLSMIERCWECACTFLTFCLGQYNVTNLDVGLWDEKESIGIYGGCGLIDCYINHDKIDDIAFRYPSYYRFQIESMGDNIGKLFSLINNRDTRPILGFLPRTNYDISIDRNKIRDLCTALEVEYEFFKYDLFDPNISHLVDELKKKVKEYKKSNPNVIDDVSYSYIDSSLSVISRPTRKKLCAIFFKYNGIIDKSTNDMLVLHNETFNNSKEQTESDIGWLVKTRNNITHTIGITNTTIPNYIFYRLKIAVFCSVFERAEYSIEEIEKIITDYFNGYIPKS